MLQMILALIFVSQALAAPRVLEVWFLSANKKAEVQQMLNEKSYIFRSMTAKLDCQEMGDFCFDPQYGLYKKDDFSAEVDTSQIELDKAPPIPTAHSVDRDLISCDSKNFFDVFCGKARKETQASYKLDVWIDTSSSMREFDFSDKEGSCFRKSMIKRLDESCGFNQKVNVMMFDTSIKQAGSMDSLCVNQGTNEYKRLIDWIERSDAKKLIVITDIYEFHKEFSDYVESKNGTLRGDKDPLIASQLLELVSDLSSSCR